MVGASLSFWAASREPAALLAVPLLLAVNWFGDSLDGTVARLRKVERPRYGYYLDHCVDLVGTGILMLGMGFSGHMTPAVAVATLTAYFLMAAQVFLATHSVGVFRIHFAGCGPTELRIFLSFGAIVAFFNPRIVFGASEYLLFDVAGLFAVVGMLAAFSLAFAQNLRVLARREPRRTVR